MVACINTWWRHQMETPSALLALCAGNSPGTGEFPAQRPVTWSFGVFFDLRMNKRLSKQSWGLWFETPSRPLWRHRNELVTIYMYTVTNNYTQCNITNPSRICLKLQYREIPSPHNIHFMCLNILTIKPYVIYLLCSLENEMMSGQLKISQWTYSFLDEYVPSHDQTQQNSYCLALLMLCVFILCFVFIHHTMWRRDLVIG